MTPQPSLFPRTVKSPLCLYVHCTKKGRATLGEPIDCDGCVNRSVTCQCGRTGVISTRTDA